MDSRLGVVSNATLGHYRQTGSGVIAWIRLKLQNPQGGRKSTQPTDGGLPHALQPGKTLSLALRNAVRPCADSETEGSRLREVKRNPQTAKERFRVGTAISDSQEPDSGVMLSFRVLEQRKRKGEEWPLATLN